MLASLQFLCSNAGSWIPENFAPDFGPSLRHKLESTTKATLLLLVGIENGAAQDSCGQEAVAPESRSFIMRIFLPL